jgi:hypothetical protein
MSTMATSRALRTPRPLSLSLPIRMPRKSSLAAPVIALVLFLCGCSAVTEGTKSADAAVQHFHQQLNSEQYEQTYSEANEGFRSGQKHEELIKFLGAVHRKLGNAGEAKLVNIQINATTNGKFLAASYETKFANGPATESFTWKKNGGRWELFSYHIQSMALIMN